MVSPLRTLQSSNSLRKSIASLAWFNASCMGRLLSNGLLDPLVGWAKSSAVSFPRGHGARTILPTHQHRNRAPLPTLHEMLLSMRPNGPFHNSCCDGGAWHVAK